MLSVNATKVDASGGGNMYSYERSNANLLYFGYNFLAFEVKIRDRVDTMDIKDQKTNVFYAWYDHIIQHGMNNILAGDAKT